MMLQNRLNGRKGRGKAVGGQSKPEAQMLSGFVAKVLEQHKLAAYEILEQTVALAFGVSSCALRDRTRGKAREALARQVAMYLAHVVYCQSLTEVGLVFGRDRTTVSHACGVIEDMRDDPAFDRSMDQLEFALYRFAAASLLLAPATIHTGSVVRHAH